MAASLVSAKSATVYMTALVSVKSPAQFTSTPTSFVANQDPPPGEIHAFVTTSAETAHAAPSAAKPTICFRIFNLLGRQDLIRV